MNSSCVVLKNNSSIYRPHRPKKTEECNLVNAVMWTLGSLLVSFNVQLSNNHSGIVVSVTVANLLLMLLTTVLLGKGLKESNAYYAIPWILVSFWSMYHIQIFDIYKLYLSLIEMNDANKISSYLSWLSLLAYTIALLIRLRLTITVAYVALEQWYNKKLREEISSSLDKEQ